MLVQRIHATDQENQDQKFELKVRRVSMVLAARQDEVEPASASVNPLLDGKI